MKRKNKRKHLKLSHIMVLFVTFLICISISYCRFSTDLKISGSVNASLPMGNSQYTVEYRSSGTRFSYANTTFKWAETVSKYY